MKHRLSHDLALLNIRPAVRTTGSTSALFDSEIRARMMSTLEEMDYLKRVKRQFASKPRTYYKLLEAVKCYRNHTLDLVGAVKRIGALFLRSTYLVKGFSTFLPVGYRIDVSSDRAERIIVYSPAGKLLAFSEDELLQERRSSRLGNIEQSIGPRRVVNGSFGEGSMFPPESSSALSFVSRMKIRLRDTPEVYKQFLEMLESYDEDQQDIPTASSGKPSAADALLLNKVAELFANHKDLLEEFSQFLPDASLTQPEEPGPSAASTSCEKITDLLAPLSLTDGNQHIASLSPEPSPAAGDSNQGCIRTARTRRKRRRERARSSLVAHTESCIARKRARKPAELDPIVTSRRKIFGQQTSSQKGYRAKRPSQPISFEMYTLIDQVRRALNNDDLYTTFLCVLQLFNLSYLRPCDVQDILHSFLGNNTELKEWLSRVITSAAAASSSANAEHSNKDASQKEEGTVSDCLPNGGFCHWNQSGVSYRFIPTCYQYPASAGRTVLGKEVLNFKYLSFPTWQSEENPPIAIKRSVYDETLYSMEDQRFEADMVIAANHCLIDALHDVTARMEREQSDLEDFHLDEALNTGSVTVAQRALRLVFNDAWEEFYTSLRDSPSQTIELVLHVLMKKNEEWEKNLSSMNRLWRERNEKSYWKALEHQCTTFKQKDLKTMRARSLVNNIETLYQQRCGKAEKENREVPSGPHITLQLPSFETAFYDVGDLVIHYLEQQANVNSLNKRRIIRIIKVLLPALFQLEPGDLSDTEGELLTDNDKKNMSIGSETSDRSSSEDGELPRVRRLNRKGKTSENTSATSTEVESTADGENNEKVQDIVILQDLKLLRAMPEYTVMFMPNPWYVFLRLYYVLDERLSRFYEICCDLVKRRGEPDSTYLYQTVVLRNRFASGNNIQPLHLYDQLVSLIKHRLDGSIDSVTYEDVVRDVFSLHASKAFTIMRIVQTMTRQLLLMVTDLTALKAFKLYETWTLKMRWNADLDQRRLLEENYQNDAMALIVPENCIKIVFLPLDNRKVTFELLHPVLPSEVAKEYQKHNDSVSQEAGKYVELQFLQRNVNQAIEYFGKELAKRKKAASEGRQEIATSRSASEIARSACQRLYWRCSNEADKERSVSEPAVSSFDLRLYKNFWHFGKEKKDKDQQWHSKHGERFCSFHENWIVQNSTKERCRFINELLLGEEQYGTEGDTWVQRLEERCDMRPPYYAINRYLKFRSNRVDLSESSNSE